MKMTKQVVDYLNQSPNIAEDFVNEMFNTIDVVYDLVSPPFPKRKLERAVVYSFFD